MGYRDLWDFNAATGDLPEYGALTLMGNKFYGMTYGGGSGNFGVIFSIDTNGKPGYTGIFLILMIVTGNTLTVQH